MFRENKIKAFSVKINKGDGRPPSPFLIDLKGQKTPASIKMMAKIEKPVLWPKKIKKNIANLTARLARLKIPAFPTIKFLKYFHAAKSHPKKNKPIRHFAKPASPRFFHRETWHHAAADIVAFIALIFLILLPVQIISAYGRAKTVETKLQNNLTALKGNLAWAKSAAQNGEKEKLRKAAENIEQNFVQLKTALSQTWPLTLYPPLRSFDRLLTAGQETARGVVEILKTTQEIDKKEITLTDGLLNIQKDLNNILQKTKNSSNDLQKIERAAFLPAPIKKYAGDWKENFIALKNTGDYLNQTLVILPELLGQNQPQKYLILFQNNHEIRPTGGFIGSFAFLEIYQGKITKWSVPGGGSYDLQGSFKERLAAPTPLTLINPRFEFQDLNWFPDFPVSAKKIADVYEKAAGETVDGVIAINAGAVENLLKITGGIVLSPKKIITSSNFFEETQKAVEIDYDKTANRPKQFIADLFEKMTEQISLNFKQTAGAAKIIGLAFNSLENKDLQIYLASSEREKQIKNLGWAGEIKDTNGDYLMVVSSNIGGGKTDGAIEQNIAKETVVEADGRVISRVKIQRTHTGSKDNFWTGKRNIVYLRAYVPDGSRLLDSYGFETPPSYLFETADNQFKIDKETRQSEINSSLTTDGTQISTESGKTVFGNWLKLDPGETQEAGFVYELPFSFNFKERPALYTITIQKQAGRPNDTFSHNFKTTAGRTIGLRETSDQNKNSASNNFFAFVIN